jgi:DNA adenine methylase
MAPIVKYVGGKQKLLPRIAPLVPDGFDAYIEPFVGGGSVLEAVLKTGKCTPGRVFASDANPVVMALHAAIKADARGLVERIAELLRDTSERRYYEVRREYNEARTPERYVYLNKTGFNGLYRENKAGACNVPFGHGQRVKFVPNDYFALAELYNLYDVQFTCCAWPEALERASTRDFVYCDPPYAALTATAKFSSYTAAGFSGEDTAALVQRLVALGRAGTKVLLSNHDLAVVTDPLHGWAMDRFTVSRGGVSCKGAPRAGEVLARVNIN